MRKTFTICMLVLALLTSSMLAVFSYADQTYEDLWAEKIAYESERAIGVGLAENNWSIYYELSWQFIPYTEVGKTLTYEIKTEPFAGDFPYPPYLYALSEDTVLYSQELIDIYRESLIVPTDDRPGVCNTRKMVQTLGITEEDLRNAYATMENDPELVREVLSCLTDEEFDDMLQQLMEERIERKRKKQSEMEM